MKFTPICIVNLKLNLKTANPLEPRVKFENGALEITLEKKEVARPRFVHYAEQNISITLVTICYKFPSIDKSFSVIFLFRDINTKEIPKNANRRKNMLVHLFFIYNFSSLEL